jgi:hypothetical protein
VRVPDDDRLAAAEVEPGQRCLVGHALGEVEHVVDGIGLGLVGVEPRASQAGAEGGRVDRDDGGEATRLVLAEDDLFVAAALSEDGEP